MNSYKHKYLKYKEKYLNLRKKYQTGGDRDIFDFDKYYLDANNKYIAEYFLNNKVSKNCLETIKGEFQYLYYKFYEYLTNTSCEQILIPLFVDDINRDPVCNYDKIDINSQFRVNYEEQAKYYNKTYSDNLHIIDNLDDVLNKDKLLLQQKLSELIRLNTINQYLDLNYLILLILIIKIMTYHIKIKNINFLNHI